MARTQGASRLSRIHGEQHGGSFRVKFWHQNRGSRSICAPWVRREAERDLRDTERFSFQQGGGWHPEEPAQGHHAGLARELEVSLPGRVGSLVGPKGGGHVRLGPIPGQPNLPKPLAERSRNRWDARFPVGTDRAHAKIPESVNCKLPPPTPTDSGRERWLKAMASAYPRRRSHGGLKISNNNPFQVM